MTSPSPAASFIVILSFLLLTISCLATELNTIDQCWRTDNCWWESRQQLAKCSVGFAGDMSHNIGSGLTHYQVTDPRDDPINPEYGTLRYGTSKLTGKVWITFQRDMHIKLKRKLLVGSFTTIDGRGADVHITGGAGFLLRYVNNVIIHGLHFHHTRTQPAGPVLGPDSKIFQTKQTDGDAIRLVGSSKVWIDRNTLYNGQDGLLDVTVGSTDITISNNWFKNHDKVMLLGHDDAFLDKNMKVTVVYNRFGPNCNQRMPRIRHGYAHVANNFYQEWSAYAIGGSMNPTIRSEGNLFIASKQKEVTWSQGTQETAKSWNWRSIDDKFVNGAHFKQRGKGRANPYYNRQQRFRVQSASAVVELTKSAGALYCTKRGRC